MGWKKIFTKPISVIKGVFRRSYNPEKVVSKEKVILLNFIQFEFDDTFDLAFLHKLSASEEVYEVDYERDVNDNDSALELASWTWAAIME
jgi:hypothetical protein